MKRSFVSILTLLFAVIIILSGCNKSEPKTAYCTGSEDAYHWKDLSSYLYQDMLYRDPFFANSLQSEADMIGNSMDEQHNMVGVTLLCKYDGEIHLISAIEGCEVKFTSEDFRDMASDQIFCEIAESSNILDIRQSASTIEVVGAIVTWISYDSFGNRVGYSAMDCDGDAKWEIVSNGDLSTKASILSAADSSQKIWSYSEECVLSIPESMIVVWLPTTPDDSTPSLSAMERLV